MEASKGEGHFTKGEEASYDANEHNLMRVFDYGLFVKQVEVFTKTFSRKPNAKEEVDLGNQCWRSINLEALISLYISGEQFEVNDFPVVEWDCTWSVGGDPYHRIVKARTEGEAIITLKRIMQYSRKPKGMICQMLSTTST